MINFIFSTHMNGGLMQLNYLFQFKKGISVLGLIGFSPDQK